MSDLNELNQPTSAVQAEATAKSNVVSKKNDTEKQSANSAGKIDKHALAKRFLQLGKPEQVKFIELLSNKGLDFEKSIARICRFVDLAEKQGKNKKFVNIKVMGLPGLLNDDELKKAINFWESKNVTVSSTPGPTGRGGNVNWMPKILKKEIKGCTSIWRNDMMHILFNGEVILCCMDWKREVTLGNVKDSSIKKIWNSEKRNKIEKMFLFSYNF